ncbi:MAG TPA: cob(I)yrinic acid a,c-diamide adenosyltransferase [Pirellulaceae bacterium]|nr:cob(I)yrinic acid a,c-diamide adenosyltransferase [Pirellulaceae bacterium]
MKIYTKTGDTGETGLFAGPRVRKDDTRIEAYGDVDELNAWLGLSRAEGPTSHIDSVLSHVQHELFAVGAELATPNPDQHQMRLISEEHIVALEAAIDRSEAMLKPLTQFILPGGTKIASHLHIARCVCRRAERRVVTLAAHEPAADFLVVIRYLNRLSDLLFVLARLANAIAGWPDVPWQKPATS